MMSKNSSTAGYPSFAKTLMLHVCLSIFRRRSAWTPLMWRAYGCGAGVALVINGSVMFGNTQVLKVFSSPVAYEHPNAVAEQLTKIANNISNGVDFLRDLGRDVVKGIVFNMFLFGILCTKHPGFHERARWRAIASPQIYPTPHCTSAIEVIHGAPQRVLKLDLKNHPEEALVGLAIPELINRIITDRANSPQVFARHSLSCFSRQAC